jgi:predicted membrane protein
MLRFFRAIFLIVFGVAVISLAVANRHDVRLIIDPFISREIAASIHAPLFVYLFAALFAGVFLGAFAMWMLQGRFRREARVERREAAVWRREAENLKLSLIHI